MEAINLFIWLVVGMMAGWLAYRMVTAFIERQVGRPEIPFVDFLEPDKITGQYGTPILSPIPRILEDEFFKDQYFANDSLGG